MLITSQKSMNSESSTVKKKENNKEKQYTPNNHKFSVCFEIQWKICRLLSFLIKFFLSYYKDWFEIIEYTIAGMRGKNFNLLSRIKISLELKLCSLGRLKIGLGIRVWCSI